MCIECAEYASESPRGAIGVSLKTPMIIRQKQDSTIAKNPIAQRLIKAMEKPPHLTDEDVEALQQSIEEGKIPIRFNPRLSLIKTKNSE